ncbi:NAD-dependent epimerase/dehydratase family protein [Crassaminicella profunda]|uniref:NAD-dependent epimerase/dehydratase family protein n=1 Tax=Crassaminicella profunda TaxID=1286698 RepID=UPI001CA66EEF|nr:NAD(P)-dependent oxidoreductase [Crassaminicella profunda]QZY54023.1 NAD(P)-dependent oxidoreductase [Crassaminicella profunda]
MNVLVTGGTGFLGERLAMRLISMGYGVTVVGRNKIKGKELEKLGINFIPLDLADQEKTIAVCKNQSYIFHCAALSSPWGRYKDFYASNVLSTKNLIMGIKKWNVKRLVHVSTPSIYFDYTDRLNIPENSPLPKDSVNFYAQTKLMAEKEIDKAYKDGLEVISIRPRALFGPGDTTILPRLIRANNKRFIPLINEGKAVVDVTYVENVVDALLLCMDSDENTLGQKYNITNGEPMMLIELLQKLFDKLNVALRGKNISFEKAYRFAGILEFISKYLLLGKEPTLTQYSVGVLAKSQTLDIQKARKELRYKPRISIDEGLEYFVDWLKGDGSWVLK